MFPNSYWSSSAATFLMQLSDHSIVGAGILDGDHAVVKRGLQACPGHVVVATVVGGMTIKRLRRRNEGCFMPKGEP